MKVPHAPQSAYELFVKQIHYEVKRENPYAHREERYKIMNNIWTELMSDDEKEPYLLEASQLLREWNIKMEQYRQYCQNLIKISAWSDKYKTYVIEIE